jgi:hypothetical protein
MKDLICKIGELNIDSKNLICGKSRPSAHKYVVTGINNVASVYACKAKTPEDVAEEFRLSEEKLVGGGALYVMGDRRRSAPNFCLVMEDVLRGCKYGCISEYAAERFLGLIYSEFELSGVESEICGKDGGSFSILVCQEGDLNDYWLQFETRKNFVVFVD